jgi:hypothetical protein
VYAVNAAGSSVVSTQYYVGHAGRDNSCTNQHCWNGGQRTGTLAWTAPATNGGTISDYTIQYSSDSGSTWTTFSDTVSATASVTVTGLTNGTAYVFRVAATNQAGLGAYSTSSAARTPVGPPGAPTNLVGVAGNAQVALTWTAPVSNGGSAITDYVIRYSRTMELPRVDDIYRHGVNCNFGNSHWTNKRDATFFASRQKMQLAPVHIQRIHLR